MQSPIDNPTILDRLGIWISGLCALHCLAIPVLPLLASSVFGEVWFERTILSLSILIGSVALIVGAIRYHGQVYPLLLLLSGGAIYWFKNMFGEAGEPFTIAVGAMLIIVGHWLNMRLCRKCRCCHGKIGGQHLADSN
ncbi:MerC domain-containing protein [Aestuariibacter sp. GS-14]|uniref:MerC domain-containing protein n=1 Tax=Alteromonadaceae TaxID=72275 RepID=UPI001128CEB3|nr:MerC domain-containing protein [Aestuariibacter sp. GS-14]TPV58368.1 MerC domain-containing protein [Aestuariibacter sp. GS-14]